MPYTAWVADVEDSCILGLNFLRTIGGVLDLGKDRLLLPEEESVQLIPPIIVPTPSCLD